MIITVEFGVSTGYQGCDNSETMQIELDDKKTQEEIDNIIQEYYDTWLFENIETYWEIKN